MFAQFELFTIGAAAVLDVVLLVVLIDRSNRHLTALWLKLAVIGVACWHVAGFIHLTLQNSSTAFAIRFDDLCMMVMAFGLVLMNCGIFHGAIRLNATGTITHPPTNFRYVFVYLPLLMVVDAAVRIAASPSRGFSESVRANSPVFLAWLLIANIGTAILFLRNRNRVEIAQDTSRLLRAFAWTCLGVVSIVGFYILQLLQSEPNQWLRLMAAFSPVLPALLFAWFIFRRQIVPIIFERTLVYGAILLAVIYLHRLFISQFIEQASQQIQVDLLVIEGLVATVAVLSISPLRKRVRDGLSYLVSEDLHTTRDKARRISVAMANLSDKTVEQLADWLVREMQSALGVHFIQLRLRNPTVETFVAQDARCPANLHPADDDQLETNLPMYSGSEWLERSRCSSADDLHCLQTLNALALLPIRENEVEGILIIGLRKRGDRLNDEQLNAVQFLIDQFAATVHGVLQNDARQQAERRAAQQEKLSTLGLLSGSMAHEIRNPLSSIRTIVCLLKEETPNGSEMTQDLQMVIDEVDRLTSTTQRLLDFARPGDPDQMAIPDQIIPRLVGVLNHMARGCDVTLNCQLKCGEIAALISEADLTDVLFNLIKNAIEAASETTMGRVSIKSSVGKVISIEIVDNGRGIDPAIRDSIFDPFITAKQDGTGMGLFLVARHIQNAKGSIRYDRSGEQTVFTVCLPCSS